MNGERIDAPEPGFFPPGSGSSCSSTNQLGNLAAFNSPPSLVRAIVEDVTTWCMIVVVLKKDKKAREYLSTSEEGGPHAKGAVGDDGVVAGGEQGKVFTYVYSGG